MPAQMIAAGFNGPATDEIDFAAKDIFSFLLHPDHIKEAGLGLGEKLNKYIRIAFRPEISAQG